jgi:hypothetical protein
MPFELFQLRPVHPIEFIVKTNKNKANNPSHPPTLAKITISPPMHIQIKSSKKEMISGYL